MKRALLILTCAVSVHAFAAAPPTPPTVRWTNGESMAADLIEATGTSATWRTRLFDEPVQLAWNVIHRADWTAQPAIRTQAPVAPARESSLDELVQSLGWKMDPTLSLILPAPKRSPFLFTFRDGSALQADLLSITGTSVSVWAQRFGEVILDRSQLLSARRLHNTNLLIAGPAGDAGWHPMVNEENGDVSPERGDPQPPPLTVGAGDALQMPYWNRAAKLDVRFPDAVDIEFHLHAAERPDFRLSVERGHDSAIHLETWDSDLVVVCGSEFQLVRKLADSDRDVALRFCWNWKSRHCAIFTPAGDPVVDWQAPNDHGSKLGGVLLTNKGRDLTLDYFRIRKWNGAPPPRYDPGQPRVEMDDGRVLQAEVVSGSAGALQLSGSSAKPGPSVAPDDLDAIVFSPDSPETAATPVTATYSDGTLLHGKISGVKDGTMTLVTSFSRQPVAARTDSLRHLLLGSAGGANMQPLAEMDALKFGDTTLHGRLAPSGGPDPKWLPVGGIVPVTPSKTQQYEITRYFPPGTPASTAGALFYTRAGDALPGDMHAIDRSGVEFDSGIIHDGRLPAADLSAIQFDASSRAPIDGFDSANWRVVTGNETMIHRSGNSVLLLPGGAIGNSEAMQSSEIRFTIHTDAFWGMRLRLFCAGDKPSAKMLIAGINGGVSSSLEVNENQFDEPRFSGRAPTPAVAVRLVIRPDAVDVYYNGVCAQKLPVPGHSRLGDGLIIEPMGIWGNNPQSVQISDFSLVSAPGCAWLPDIDPEAKSQALSVPRFRRDDPPRHALIAGNGDVLRGEIEAATTTSFGFRAGMDEVVVPRDRVKAVIWLPKPAEGQQPTAPPKNPAADVLNQNLRFRVGFGGGQAQYVTNFLRDQIPGVKIQFPKNMKASGAGILRIGNESLGSALDKIAAYFDCSYHIDSKGVIVFETGISGPPASLVQRVYWLKPGAFAAGDAPQKLLAAKGVPFPAGASATWNADADQLAVENTPDNQTRVAEVLNADYGGIVGSPTHWLVLANGGRIALSVEKFGADKITGWQPVYGQCSIPTADVAIVRNHPLDPSAAMLALADWKPVFAPEPVLPEAGGDSSASIGKPAGEFKLAMLGGGQFDLAQQRGKVVVLDFWATWCGPCVRSLPGLIQSMSGFSSSQVKFVGINEDEPPGQVSQFLETRGWTLPVALDDGRHVGQQYGVDGIPHTVIIGPNGKVAWVKTGYTPDGEGDAAKEVTELLSHSPPAAAPTPAAAPPSQSL